MVQIKVSIPEGVNTKTFPQAVEDGKVTIHKVRANGTTRRIPVLKGKDLEIALRIRDAREQGKSVREIAQGESQSVATVRRYLQELELTEQITTLNRSGIIRVMKEQTL